MAQADDARAASRSPSGWRPTRRTTGTRVLWCARGEDRRGGGARPGCYAAPLAVNGLIRTHLLAGRSGVLTSATLDARRRRSTRSPARSGLEVPARTPSPSGPTLARPGDAGAATPAPARAPWRGLDVGSPFDYPRQGILYIARHLPPPGREPATDAQLDEIADARRRPPGGARSACSRRVARRSRRPRRCASGSTSRSSCQGDDQLPTLVRAVRRRRGDLPVRHALAVAGRRRARADVPARASSTASRSRARTTRCSSARSEAVEAAGGNGFMAVSATHAALLLAQGAGPADPHRSTDRGVVAVLDPRLVTARLRRVPRAVAAGLLADDGPRRSPSAALRRLRRRRASLDAVAPTGAHEDDVDRP